MPTVGTLLEAPLRRVRDGDAEPVPLPGARGRPWQPHLLLRAGHADAAVLTSYLPP